MSEHQLTAAEVATLVGQARFTPVRTREGYDMTEVDRFLDEVVAAAGEGRPLAPVVDAAAFATTRWREGYEIADVDALLARLRGTTVVGAPAPEPALTDPSAAALVARVRAARFTPVRTREGYDMAGVDRLLEEVVAAATQGRPVGPLLDGASLATTRWREGYDSADVDALLDELRGAGPDADGRPATTHPATTATAPPSAPSVVAEQRGLASRLFGRKTTS